MNYIELKAPAKINIGLNIVSKRNDGFHNLETFFYPLNDLFDVLTFRKSESFSFTSDNSEIKNNDDNLIIKAKLALEKIAGKPLNVEITLTKNIPMGAGLGGGSSDCAATLVSLNELFSIGINHKQLIDVALELGSDVPFFIKAKPAIGKSRGEILDIKDYEIDKPILIVNPNIHISTKEAFSDVTPTAVNENLYESIFSKDFNPERLNEFLKNDFEENIFKNYSEIKNIKETMINHGALYTQMTGTGSTVYGIFDNVSVLETCMNSINDSYMKIINHPL